MQSNYAAIIYTYKDIPISELDRYRLSGDVMIENGKALGIAPEFFILNTCNRSELYVCSSNIDHTLHTLLEYIGREAEEKARILKGTEAVKHLFCVASGLESIIVGETEVMHQLKSAYRVHKTANYFGDKLDLLLTDAINFSKRLRRDTNISKGRTSAPYIALSLLPKYLANGQKIAVVGAGYMAGRILESLMSRYDNDCITIFDRNEDNGNRLAALFYAKSALLDFKRLDTYDFIVSAIYYNGEPVRLTGPKKIVDLSSPSLFVGENVVGINEINALALNNIKIRLDAAEECRHIIDRYVKSHYD